MKVILTIISIFFLFISMQAQSGLGVNDLDECKKENQKLEAQIQQLKKMNADLIKSMDNLATLTTRGAENLEKSLQSLKDKDEKIKRLQDALVRNDSIYASIFAKYQERQPPTKEFKSDNLFSEDGVRVETTFEESHLENLNPTSYVTVDGKRLVSGEKTQIHPSNDSFDEMTTFVTIAKENEKTMIIFWQESKNKHMNFFNEVWKGTVYIYLENGETIALVDRNKKGQNKIKNGQTSPYGYQSDLYQRFSAYYITPSECQKLKNSNVVQISYRTSSSFEEGTTFMQLTQNSDTFREQLLAIKR